MIKRLFPLLVAVVMAAVSAPPSQAALSSTWEKNVGVRLTSVAVGRDGSIYVAGSRANGSFTKALLAKLTPAGAVVWTRTWLPSKQKNPFTGGPWWSTAATSVAVGRDGAVYITGFVQKTNCEGGGWFIRSYGPGGHALHAFGRYQKTKLRQCTRPFPQFTTGIATHGHRVVVTGFDFGCCDDPATDGWVRAFDTSLHPRWQAQFEPPASVPTSWFDEAHSVSIGASGNVFVGGWAATGPPPAPGSATPYRGHGTVVLEKLTSGGAVLWSRRTNDLMIRGSGLVSVATRGARVMLTAALDGASVRWSTANRTHAWLGRFTSGGAMVWSRTWGTDKDHAAEPTGLALDATSGTWVVGTHRDPSDHGLNVFVRRYGAGGKLLGRLSIDGGVKRLTGGGIAARGADAIATGTVSVPGGDGGGRVWRISA